MPKIGPSFCSLLMLFKRLLFLSDVSFQPCFLFSQSLSALTFLVCPKTGGTFVDSRTAGRLLAPSAVPSKSRSVLIQLRSYVSCNGRAVESLVLDSKVKGRFDAFSFISYSSPYKSYGISIPRTKALSLCVIIVSLSGLVTTYGLSLPLNPLLSR